MFFHLGTQELINLQGKPEIFYKIEHGFATLGILGLGVFVIISSYFLGDQKFKSKRFFVVYFELIFYSIIFMIICFSCKLKPYTFENFISFLFPVSIPLQYFPVNYLLFLLITPFLKVGCERINKHGLLMVSVRLLLIQTFTKIFSVISAYNNTIVLTPLLWFINTYLLLYFLKHYAHKVRIIYKVSLFILLFIFIFLIRGNFFNIPEKVHSYFDLIGQPNDIFGFCLSYLLFSITLDINKYDFKIAAIVARTTLGTLIIHNNTKLWLFNYCIPLNFLQSKSVFSIILYQLLFTFFICVFCFIVDILRYYLFERQIFRIKLINSICLKIDFFLNLTNYF